MILTIKGMSYNIHILPYYFYRETNNVEIILKAQDINLTAL